MDRFQTDCRYDCYKLCRKLLLLSGLWPYDKFRNRLLHMGVIIVYDISIMFVQIANYFVCDTIQCVFKTLPMNMMAVMVLVKIFTYHFNRQKIKGLLEHLHSDWNVLHCEEEFVIMKKYAETGRFYSFFYATSIYSITFFIFGCTVLVSRFMDIVSPLNESRPIILPCPANYFVDEEEYFYYICVHLLIGAFVCITGLVAHDCNFFTFVEHVCGLFEIVGFRFEHLLYERNIKEKSLIEFSDNIYVKNIEFSIEAHRRALHFVALLENTFCLSFAVQLLIVTTGMSITLLYISSELQGDMIEVVRFVPFVIGQLGHLLIYSYEGQKIINHSLELCQKIYNGLWYNIPVKSQRLLLFAMRKNVEPSFVSAGKIYIFCLESFTSVLQCSLSYFTVLSTFNEP
ncbi:odorant receptor 13a-like isoform X2 [Harpegnathos saltator]|uniref:odorant receptor 13a-like isoform X2 n=1 Tax=Harpegnathos saltator TaxID=610380 RepID=UPI000DBEE460|nr:odorant receptor 13a-like isoform X2 [Harpegnathos saltator]